MDVFSKLWRASYFIQISNSEKITPLTGNLNFKVKVSLETLQVVPHLCDYMDKEQESLFSIVFLNQERILKPVMFCLPCFWQMNYFYFAG